jgi:hypothetical protein
MIQEIINISLSLKICFKEKQMILVIVNEVRKRALSHHYSYTGVNDKSRCDLCRCVETVKNGQVI